MHHLQHGKNNNFFCSVRYEKVANPKARRAAEANIGLYANLLHLDLAASRHVARSPSSFGKEALIADDSCISVIYPCACMLATKTCSATELRHQCHISTKITYCGEYNVDQGCTLRWSSRWSAIETGDYHDPHNSECPTADIASTLTKRKFRSDQGPIYAARTTTERSVFGYSTQPFLLFDSQESFLFSLLSLTFESPRANRLLAFE